MEIAEKVSRYAQLSMLLEVSSYPKPGNVHRLKDFKNTKYEHFLMSSVVSSYYFRKIAFRSIKIVKRKLGFDKIGVGRIIRECIADVMESQLGGNTCLGTVTLLVPLTAASAMAMYQNKNKIREILHKLVRSTTYRDSIEFYKAVRIARPGGIGKSNWLDVYDDNSFRIIKRDKISLFKIFQYASSYDSIAYEWISDFKISFEIGYPYLYALIKDGYNINTAIVHTFLKILSEVPDTLIARKTNISMAKKVSKMAKDVLWKGGLNSKEGKESLVEMDKILRSHGNLLNPGTTADLTASSIMLVLLKEIKF